MAPKTVRRSISMTPEMRDLLAQIVAKRGREVKENDVIREAIRQHLDQQADVVGSRRHFQKSLQARLDQMESTLVFQMQVLTYLLAAVPERVCKLKPHQCSVAKKANDGKIAAHERKT